MQKFPSYLPFQTAFYRQEGILLGCVERFLGIQSLGTADRPHRHFRGPWGPVGGPIRALFWCPGSVGEAASEH